ncbi:Actin-related protein 8 [Hibiscus syriacus]|uniref:Actin-related protein 8 n=1 Tax=Hibiscus syriacus TaxID=106335 RepID=A0A6A3APL9_HIBSY|nr:Actin-related protein 8 [Hibiscus syriacus]
MGEKQVVMETYCREALDMIQDDNREAGQLTILQLTRSLRQRLECNLKHTHRESNTIADALAKWPGGYLRITRNSDVDENDYSNNKISDTSAAQARRGKDIQGIPWDRLSITREKYRQTRIEQYKNYENISNSGERSGKLRNLVWATSKHDVYLMSHFSVIHWFSLKHKREILNVSGHVAPSEVLLKTQVSTLAVKDKLLVAGGFQGELICKHISLSPDGKLLIIVGDNPDVMLVDSDTGKTVMPLDGHLDHSFASAWHLDGVSFATGNQDKTCLIWDVRNLFESVAVLKGNLGAMQSVRYTSDGSPDTESLFIGVWDRTYGSLLEYGRRRNYAYLDSLIM